MAGLGMGPESRRLGDFEIVGELGRGGMGVVYVARQVSLNREVALKVLGNGLGLTPNAVLRFRREAEAAAKLHHTNIVPVYATGEQDGTHFYAMERIDGPSLDRVLRDLRAQAAAGRSSRSGPTSGRNRTAEPSSEALDATVAYGDGFATTPAPALGSSSLSAVGSYYDTVARLIAEVADALDYAHENGVIHRDIKPSNLLLSPAGRLSLNDFGLARVLDGPGMTTTGEFVGTPTYMSPEQVASGRIPLDHRTDIYSLGATLYELLTLEPPHKGESREQVLAQIVQKEPMAPRRARKGVPVDLETICLKCLEKDPDRRYPTAGALAEDLRRYVNRFAISARRAGPVGRAVKWARRRPGIAASLGGLLLAVGAALGFAYLAHRAEERRRIEHEEARAQLLDEKIRNAYMVATSGDLKATDEAIKEIEALGASTGQVRLLRGVVAYFRQEIGTAVGELEQAVRLLPRSIAARALLSIACAEAGDEERHGQLDREIDRLTPTTPEDSLFRGYARQVDEPGEGLEDVDEGLRRRDSPLGRALRAIVRANRAIDTARPEDADAALADADLARAMRPDNQLVLYAGAYARLMAAAVYGEAGLGQKRREALESAGRDVRGLEPYLGQSNPLWIVWQYHEDIGDPAGARDVALRSLRELGAPVAAGICAATSYRDGRFAEALEYLDRRRDTDVIEDVMRTIVLAELPDGPRRALELCDAMARRHPGEVWELRYRANLLMLLGKKEQARAALRGFRPPFVRSPGWAEFFEAMRRYGCEEISEGDYLARAGRSGWKRGYAHYEIGLSRLADGDRAGAREHFAAALKARAIWEFQWNWSQMLLSRLESDPRWPPWIPATK